MDREITSVRSAGTSIGVLALLLFPIGSIPRAQTDPDPEPTDALLDWLDRDRDGRVGPYEGAEAWLHLTALADEDGDGALAPEEVSRFLAERRAEQRDEGRQMFAELDTDGDGGLRRDELPGEVRVLFAEVDTDGSGRIELTELQAVDFDDPRLFLRAEILHFFEKLDEQGLGRVPLEDLPADERRELVELDANGDGALTVEELMVRAERELEGLGYSLSGPRATLTGTIGASTPGRILELILEHPEVEELWLVDMPGSMDDEANLRAARLVRQRGFTTVAVGGGEIASGAVDFFLAGEQRRVDPGARLGVHSWAGFGEEGGDLPREHPEHRLFLDFYAEMEIPAEFYWYTLEVAPSHGIHWMSAEEIARYGVETGRAPRDESPAARGTDDPPPGSADPYGLDAIEIPPDSRGIAPLPVTVDPVLRAVFDRYTRVRAPSGRPIHILAQSGWTDDQIVRARKVLEFLLEDAPGTRHGADKSAVAEAMAERRATLVLFDDEPSMEAAFEGPLGELELGMQDLRANECPVEGTDDYMACGTRDAAFEEILHLVHDYGIRPALPEYDAEIQRGNDRAAAAGLWDPWPEDEPDSHRNEYIAVLVDNYYDLWTVPPSLYEGQELDPDELPGGTSHFGTYRAGSRERLGQLDPKGLSLVRDFLPGSVSYGVELPEEFTGEFRIELDPGLRYTVKAQHLRDVCLRGSNPAGLVGNEHQNLLVGNAGDNWLEGRGQWDCLEGGAGIDTAIYSGPAAEYELEWQGSTLRVKDLNIGRDGIDVLVDVERLRFADGEISVSKW